MSEYSTDHDYIAMSHGPVKHREGCLPQAVAFGIVVTLCSIGFFQVVKFFASLWP